MKYNNEIKWINISWIIFSRKREEKMKNFIEKRRRKRAVWIIFPRYRREKILICLLGVQPCFVERYFRFSLLLQVPEYFGVSRRKKKKQKSYYRLWVWVSTGPSMNTINQLAIPFSSFYARQLYRISRSVIWGEEGTSSRGISTEEPEYLFATLSSPQHEISFLHVA